jgi:hypothetical protein
MAHRGQWSELEARGVLSAWRRSGQSIERFGKERGIVPQRIRWWKTKLEGSSTALVRSASPLALLPVQVTESYESSTWLLVAALTSFVVTMNGGQR